MSLNNKIFLDKVFNSQELWEIKVLIFQYNRFGELVDKFHTIGEASRKTGINRSSISACINGRVKTAFGFKWKRIYNFDIEIL